jgi:molybdopterin-containing oxidoreductase family iron-sulfur binding subunit
MPDETTQPSTLDRRKFLTVLGTTTAGGALALGGCSTQRVEKLVPYLVQSEDQVPGVATRRLYHQSAPGMRVHIRTGRLGRSSWRATRSIRSTRQALPGQAGLQGLYNPGRIQAPMARGANGTFQAIGWDDAVARLAAKLGEAGNRVAVVSGAGRGSFTDLLGEWTAALGGRLVRYETFDHEPLRAANRQVFGLDQVPAHDFGKARYIVSFGADFLESWGSSMENQRGFARSHGFEGGDAAKFVYAAPRMDLTGLNADEWLPIKPGSEAALALAMANVLLAGRADAPAGLAAALGPHTPALAAQETGIPAERIERLAREFAAARPSLAVAGGVGTQHAAATEVCAAVNILNFVAGNVGETVLFGADLPMGTGRRRRSAGPRSTAARWRCSWLRCEPALHYAWASGFAERFRKVGFKVAIALCLDETAAECDLVLPERHALERWDDLRPRAGVYGLMQPVMEPVFDALAPGEILLRVAQKAGGALARFDAPSWEAHLKSRWQALAGELGEKDPVAFWHAAVQRGGVFRDPPAPPAVSLALGEARVAYTKPTFEGDGEFVFLTYPHGLLHDGRGANKPWLLENADPVTKITWPLGSRWPGAARAGCPRRGDPG